uniref:Uncharacterized protein n=1 Tax=Arundo donax TaxID=35708 RepID=A0A0A9B648_ARUDO
MLRFEFKARRCFEFHSVKLMLPISSILFNLNSMFLFMYSVPKSWLLFKPREVYNSKDL